MPRIDTLRQLRKIPFRDLLNQDEDGILISDQVLFIEGYEFFVLSFERLKSLLRLGRLYEQNCLYANGRFNTEQKHIAKKFHATKRYLELDWIAFLVFTRILLDRYAKFIFPEFKKLKIEPSPNSFNKHRDYFIEKPFTIKKLKAYKNLIEMTKWFNCLKDIRDDFIVHAYKQSGYMRVIGTRNKGNWGDSIFFVIPAPKNKYDKILHGTYPLFLELSDIVTGVYTFLWTANKILKQ